MKLTATGALMRLAETVYAERLLDDLAAPPGREMADAALVLAAAGSARWAEIAARIVDAWKPAEQVDYLRAREDIMPDTVRDQFGRRAAWPEPVAAGEQMVELAEIEGGAVVIGDGLLDMPIGSVAMTDQQIEGARFNQIETRVNDQDERLSHIESALDAYEAGVQVVAAALARHILRSGNVPRWRSLEEFEALIVEVMASEQVPLDGLLPDLSAEGA